MRYETSEVERAIIQEVERRRRCSFDELLHALPSYSWNQLFAAVDHLSRNGIVTLQHPTRFGFHIESIKFGT